MRQVWEVDLHPEEGCGGPLDLHLALDVDPRVLLSFEDAVVLLAEDEEPPDEFHFPLTFTWALPPLPSGPDLLRLAIDLAGVGGIELPLEVSAIDSFANATDGSERRLSIVARTRCRWPGSSAARSSCATSSTVPWPSAASCSSPPNAGWLTCAGRAPLRCAAGHSGSPRLVGVAALGLSACVQSTDGQSLARQACVHVHRSVSDYLLAADAGTRTGHRGPLAGRRPTRSCATRCPWPPRPTPTTAHGTPS